MRLAGQVSEQVIAGHGMLRVDVPEVNRQPAFTRLYGVSAIYSITPVSEEIAKAAAEGFRERPVNVYIAVPQLAEAIDRGQSWDDEDEEDFDDGKDEDLGW